MPDAKNDDGATEPEKDEPATKKAAETAPKAEKSTGQEPAKPEGAAKTEPAADTAKVDAVKGGDEQPDVKPETPENQAQTGGDEKLIEEARTAGYNDGYLAALNDRASDPDDTGSFPEHDLDKMADGEILCVVLRLPRTLRVGGLGARLDELRAFINRHDGNDRYIAASMIKAVSEARPEDIANGQFKFDVANAMRILNGEGEQFTAAASSAADREAAHKRLMGASSSNKPPADFVKASQEGGSPQPGPVVKDGSPDQNAAQDRLYTSGGSVDQTQK